MDATVSFDLDGVLMRNPFELGVEPHVAALIGDGAVHLAALTAEGRLLVVRAEIERVFVRRLRRDPLSAFDWDAVYAEASGCLNARVDLPDVAELVRRFVATPDMIERLIGATEALEHIHAAGLRCVAITNGYSTFQLPVLEALGLADAFDAVISPLETGCVKPHASMFASVRGLVAHVGDSIWHDVVGARAAGVAALWSHRDGPRIATTEPGIMAAAVSAVARRDPHRLVYTGLEDDDLVPDVAGCRPDDVVHAWLETRGARRPPM